MGHKNVYSIYEWHVIQESTKHTEACTEIGYLNWIDYAFLWTTQDKILSLIVKNNNSLASDWKVSKKPTSSLIAKIVKLYWNDTVVSPLFLRLTNLSRFKIKCSVFCVLGNAKAKNVIQVIQAQQAIQAVQAVQATRPTPPLHWRMDGHVKVEQ